MTTQVIALGTPTSDTEDIIWTLDPRPAIADQFVDDTHWLGQIKLGRNNSSLISVRIFLTVGSVGALAGGGQDFTSEFENDGQLIFEASDGTILTLNGLLTDPTEPYQFAPPNDAEVRAFGAHVFDLADQAVTLTLTDEIAESEYILVTTTDLPQELSANQPGLNLRSRSAGQVVFNYNCGVGGTVNRLTFYTNRDDAEAGFGSSYLGLLDFADGASGTFTVNIIDQAFSEETDTYVNYTCTTGGVEVTGSPFRFQFPASAVAPTVTIAAVGTVDEGSTQALSAEVADGIYDTLAYAWTVESGGGSIGGTGASVTYTPPDVDIDTLVTVRCTVTASGTGTLAVDGTSDTALDEEDFTVIPLTTAPSFADDTGDAQDWIQGTAITPITVPVASGIPTPTYAAVGSLSAGISFNTSTRVISGTPTATGSSTITIRATNSEGSDDWSVAYTILTTSTSWTLIADATSGNTLAYTIIGLANGTVYEIEVRASNSQGDGPWSDGRQATPSADAVQPIIFATTRPETIINVESATPEITVESPSPDVIVNIPGIPVVVAEVFLRPGKPTILTLTEAGSHKMRITWEDSDQSGSHEIEYYDLRLRSGLEWTVIDRLSPDGEHAVRGLANDAEYDFQVRAVSDAGPSSWSDIRSAIPQASRVRTIGLKFMVNWDNRLWGITSFGQLYYSYDFTSGWIESSDIPDHHTPVTAMFIYRDGTGEPVIYVMTETGLWIHDLDNERFLLTDVRFPRIPDGGKGSMVWRGDLYIPQGTQVYRYGGGGTAVLSLVGPGREQGVPWPGESKIVKLEGTHNALLAAVQNTESEDPEGTSHIIAYDGVGWQSAWTPGEHEVLNDILVGTIYGDYSVWLAHGDDLSVIDLPRDIINPSHVSANRRYADSAFAITPWVNANEPELLKVALTIKAEAARLSETETLKVEYALDYDMDTWYTVKFVGTNNADPPVSTTYDVLDSNAMGAFLGDYDGDGDPVPRSQGLVSFNLKSDDSGFPVENESGEKANGIPFYAIRFRITGVSENTERSPHLNMIGVEFKRHLETQWGFQIQVDLSYSERGLSPAELRKELIKVAESDVLVPFSYVTEKGEDVTQYVDVQTSGLVEGSQGEAPVSDAIRMIQL